MNAEAYEEILVNSIFSRESILRAYGLRSKVCYLGVDTSLFRSLNKARERFVVSVGACYPTKGVELAINSVALLKDPRPPLVWIANSVNSDFVEQMKAFANKVGVQLDLRIRVSDAELVDTLNRAAVMLYAPHLEPFGLAPLEAGACGTPVVGIPEGGVRETVIHELNGLMADPEPQSIAAAIEKLLDDPSLAQRYGQQAIEQVNRQWTVEASIDRLEEQLLRIAERGEITSTTSAATDQALTA
jgi:glycosyltransferase involved in cell wall biosynthesis